MCIKCSEISNRGLYDPVKIVWLCVQYPARGARGWGPLGEVRVENAVSALPFTSESEVKPGRTGLQLDGWPPGYSPVLILELGTHVSRVAVVGLSRASRVFLRVLRFSSLRKINT